MTLPAWIKNRWIVVPAILITSVTLWNLYVAAHNTGMIEGRVVDATGRPVPNATVTLFERGFVTHTAKEKTITDASGHFRFTDFQNHAMQLEAKLPDLGRSERRSVRLWFRGQDTSLVEPLRLAGRLP